MVFMTHGEPMRGLMLYQRELLRGPELPNADAAAPAWAPTVEVLEQADAIRVVAELPGVQPKDVSVWLEGRKLTIAANRTQAESEPGLQEFERSFGLSPAFDFKNICATYDLGVLTVTLPKAEVAKRRQIPVAAHIPVAVQIPAAA
jgi:HSP20 family protein